MSWIKDLISPKTRQWEDFYRNRWQFDKVVRSTHGANCTGGCSWMIHIKNGVVVWETQALDYPIIDKNLPPYEPRGCQRGISASWYLYSPIRVKYPLVQNLVKLSLLLPNLIFQVTVICYLFHLEYPTCILL